jgi:subtilisin family serine protease
MKKLLFLFCFAFMLNNLNGQMIYPDFWDGVVYFKFKNDYSGKLPNYKEGMDYQSLYQRYPEFINMIEDFQITEIVSPFRVKNENVSRIYRIYLKDHQNIDFLIRSLLDMNEVEYAEKSPILNIFYSPNDPDTSQQYYLSAINAYAAWNLTTGDPNVKIAIVDDAVRVTHPDIAANIWINPGEIPGNGIDDDGNGYIDDMSGWDAADNDNDPNAPLNPPFFWGELAFTHGTHCSGLAAGVTNNGIGISSVSHNVSLIPIKAVSSSSWLPLAIGAPAEGVDYAIAAGAHIVSMSFGGEQASGFNTLEALINAGHQQGIIFVAAAGNNGDGNGLGTANAINYPAGFEHVLAVGATNSTDIKPGFSQYGTWIDVMAPGVGIYSTLAWSSPYGNQDGTSMACPIVAGALGLMKSFMPLATKEQMIFCLKYGCDNIDTLNPSFAGEMGAGRINVYNSLQCLMQYQSIVHNSQGNFVLFPNPASDKLNISFDRAAEKTISIVDLNGKKISAINTESDVLDVNVAHLPAGIYVILVDQSSVRTTQKFIIQR